MTGDWTLKEDTKAGKTTTMPTTATATPMATPTLLSPPASAFASVASTRASTRASTSTEQNKHKLPQRHGSYSHKRRSLSTSLHRTAHPTRVTLHCNGYYLWGLNNGKLITRKKCAKGRTTRGVLAPAAFDFKCLMALYLNVYNPL